MPAPVCAAQEATVLASSERSACPTYLGKGATGYRESRGGAGNVGWGLGVLFLSVLFLETSELLEESARMVV